MGKKSLHTPRSRVKAALRQLWLRSRERAKALKDAGYRCTECDVKQSVAKGREVKLEVHHLSEIDWKELIDLVYEKLLSVPQVPLCKPCHKIETEKQNEERIAKGM
jgi:predicted HNH restriction endonuclease